MQETENSLLTNFTPREIVSELDRYIIGQDSAKRAVAIALRNRWRRQQVPADLRDEIAPKNIIMIGPTGVGKTEIARRLARLSQAPFLKVEASKYTEVGYVGRDVESMIRDLVEISFKLVQDEETQQVQVRAQELAEEKLLDLLVPPRPPGFEDRPDKLPNTSITLPTSPADSGPEDSEQGSGQKTRETGDEVDITKAEGEVVTIAKADIKKIEIDKLKSLMPEDLTEALTIKDYQNLLSFMMLQKGQKQEATAK